MSIQLHVNGEASIWIGKEALFQLGVSVDGVTIDLNVRTEDVFTDHFGITPFDVMIFPEEARITCQLILYDQSILEDVLGRIRNHNTVGTPNEAGTLLLGDMPASTSVQHWFRLLIKATGGTSERCWNFPYAFCTGADRFKIGTRKTIHQLEFRALNSQGSGAASTSLLYNGTCN